MEGSKQLCGKRLEFFLAACIIACRKAKVPTFGEISSLVHISNADIARAAQSIKQVLHVKSQLHNTSKIFGFRPLGELEYSHTISANTSDLMVRFCNRLGLPINIEVICVDLAKQMAN